MLALLEFLGKLNTARELLFSSDELQQFLIDLGDTKIALANETLGCKDPVYTREAPNRAITHLDDAYGSYKQALERKRSFIERNFSTFDPRPVHDKCVRVQLLKAALYKELETDDGVEHSVELADDHFNKWCDLEKESIFEQSSYRRSLKKFLAGSGSPSGTT